MRLWDALWDLLGAQDNYDRASALSTLALAMIAVGGLVLGGFWKWVMVPTISKVVHAEVAAQVKPLKRDMRKVKARLLITDEADVRAEAEDDDDYDPEA